MSRSEIERIHDMLGVGKGAMEYVEGCSFNEMQSDAMRLDAILYCLIIFGEASGHVGEEFQTNHPNIPWPAIKSLRNIIAHSYFRVNMRMIYDVCTVDMPPVVEALQAYADTLPPPKN